MLHCLFILLEANNGAWLMSRMLIEYCFILFYFSPDRNGKASSSLLNFARTYTALNPHEYLISNCLLTGIPVVVFFIILKILSDTSRTVHVTCHPNFDLGNYLLTTTSKIGNNDKGEIK